MIFLGFDEFIQNGESSEFGLFEDDDQDGVGRKMVNSEEDEGGEGECDGDDDVDDVAKR